MTNDIKEIQQVTQSLIEMFTIFRVKATEELIHVYMKRLQDYETHKIIKGIDEAIDEEERCPVYSTLKAYIENAVESYTIEEQQEMMRRWQEKQRKQYDAIKALRKAKEEEAQTEAE